MILRYSALAVCVFFSSCSSIPRQAEVDGYRVEYKRVDPQPVITTRRQVRMENLSSAFAQCLPAAFSFAQSSGAVVAGQPVAIYHQFDGKEVDVEMGCPVEATVAGRGEMESREIPGGKVLVTSHFGSYSTLRKGHEALKKSMAAFGLEPAGPCWEVFVSDPTQTAPDEVQTDIYYPVR